MFVAGISGTRPKTRALVTERTWAHQTKSAFSDGAHVAPWLVNSNAVPRALTERGDRAMSALGRGTASHEDPESVIRRPLADPQLQTFVHADHIAAAGLFGATVE